MGRFHKYVGVRAFVLPALLLLLAIIGIAECQSSGVGDQFGSAAKGAGEGISSAEKGAGQGFKSATGDNFASAASGVGEGIGKIIGGGAGRAGGGS